LYRLATEAKDGNNLVPQKLKNSFKVLWWVQRPRFPKRLGEDNVRSLGGQEGTVAAKQIPKRAEYKINSSGWRLSSSPVASLFNQVPGRLAATTRPQSETSGHFLLDFRSQYSVCLTTSLLTWRPSCRCGVQPGPRPLCRSPTAGDRQWASPTISHPANSGRVQTRL